MRNCGFSKRADKVACSAGTLVKMTCSIAGGAKPQVICVCERNAKLNTGPACTYADAKATALVEAGAVTFDVTCPAAAALAWSPSRSASPRTTESRSASAVPLAIRLQMDSHIARTGSSRFLRS